MTKTYDGVLSNAYLVVVDYRLMKFEKISKLACLVDQNQPACNEENSKEYN